jgi:hypothetical protein
VTGASAKYALVRTELFDEQMALLSQEARETIWRSLGRARAGKPTGGIDRPWDGPWLLWPCGERKVLMREMTTDEVKEETGTLGEGYLLYALRPPPI